MENGAGEASDAPATSAGESLNTSPLTTVNEKTPDGEKTLEQLRAEALDGENIGARKLTFSQQCGAFAALYAGVRNQIVARAFGISLQCASKISGCLEYDPDPYRMDENGEKILMDHNRNRRSSKRHHYYETVAREFEALGAEEFNRRYLTERVLNRIIVAKAEQREEKRQNGLQKKSQK